MRRSKAFLTSLVALTLLGFGYPLCLPLEAEDAPAKKAADPKTTAPKTTAPKTADPKTSEKKDAKAETKPAVSDKDLLKEWANLSARQKKVLDAASKLKADFTKADKDKAAQKTILESFQKQVPVWQKEMQEVLPKLLQLAPLVLEKEPLNAEAAEAVISTHYQNNQYEEVIAITDRFIAAGKATPQILTFAGISNFAVHDFEKSEKILKQAEKLDPDLFPQIGTPYLVSAADYIGLWKKEQAIRAAEAKSDDLPRVSFKTSKGEIVLELFENEAPNTVANFIRLVETKKYDGVVFHRVIPNFMAQGGDPNTLDEDPSNDGQGGPGYTIACECYEENSRKHFRGSLSMAHAGKNSGGSQFFLTHLPTPHLNPNAEEQRGHTVFGRIIKGMDVAALLKIGDKIETATVVRKRKHAYVPKTSQDEAAPTDKPNRLKLKPKGSDSKPKQEEKKEEEKKVE